MAKTQLTDILDQVRELSSADQAYLLKELRLLIPTNGEHCGKVSKGHRLLELKGLGSEVWTGVDAQEYVRRERAAWNG